MLWQHVFIMLFPPEIMSFFTAAIGGAMWLELPQESPTKTWALVYPQVTPKKLGWLNKNHAPMVPCI